MERQDVTTSMPVSLMYEKLHTSTNFTTTGTVIRLKHYQTTYKIRNVKLIARIVMLKSYILA